MRSSYGSAITHVQSGMKILSEVRYNEKTHCHEHDVLVASKLPYVSIKALEEMFMRLDRQVTQVSYTRLRKLRVLTEEADGQWARMGNACPKTREVAHILDFIQHRCITCDPMAYYVLL